VQSLQRMLGCLLINRLIFSSDSRGCIEVVKIIQMWFNRIKVWEK
jgi:hypothetical protein